MKCSNQSSENNLLFLILSNIRTIGISGKHNAVYHDDDIRYI